MKKIWLCIISAVMCLCALTAFVACETIETSESPETPAVYTVSITADNAEYGSVSADKVENVAKDTAITVNGNKIAIGETEITATANAETDEAIYSFESWSAAETVTEDITVTAIFTKTVKTYPVSVKVNNAEYGEVSVSSVPGVAYGTAITANGSKLTIGETEITATATAETDEFVYSFESWDAAESVTGETTVTAIFTKETRTYTVTVAANNAEYGSVSVPSLSGVAYGTAITANGNKLMIGETEITATATAETDEFVYAFESWAAAETVTGDITVTAVFTKAVNHKEVNYTVNHYQQKVTGDEYALAETENVTGLSWTETQAAAKDYSANGFKAANAFEQSIIAFNGSTVIDIYYDRLTYSVTFNSNGGSAVTAQTVRHGGTIVEPEAPVNENGMNFLGWYRDASFATPVNFADTVEETTELFAKWQVKLVLGGMIDYELYTSIAGGERVANANDLTVDLTSILGSATLSGNGTLAYTYTYNARRDDPDYSAREGEVTSNDTKAYAQLTERTKSKYLGGPTTEIKSEEIAVAANKVSVNGNSLVIDAADLFRGEGTFVYTTTEYIIEFNVCIANKLISTADDMLNWRGYADMTDSGTVFDATNYNYKKYKFDGYFKLTADIDLGTNVIKDPYVTNNGARGNKLIADSVNGGFLKDQLCDFGFVGTFDGDGHIVSNGKYGWGGLFGLVGLKGYVKNIALTNVTYTADGTYFMAATFATVFYGVLDNVLVDIQNANPGSWFYSYGIACEMAGAYMKNVVVYCPDTGNVNRVTYSSRPYTSIYQNGATYYPLLECTQADNCYSVSNANMFTATDGLSEANPAIMANHEHFHVTQVDPSTLDAYDFNGFDTSENGIWAITDSGKVWFKTSAN